MRIADMSLCLVLLSHVCSGDSSCLAALLARFLSYLRSCCCPTISWNALSCRVWFCWLMHMLVLLYYPVFFFSCCYLLWSLGALYLLCISLGEGQLGGHMEHDLLLSVDGVDRLRTSLTMWHIQTSSKPARGWRQQNTCTNPPDLKILQHKRPWFDSQLDKEGSGYRNIDNGVWMCILVLLGGGGVFEGTVSHPLKSCSSTVSPNSCRKSLKAGVSSLFLNSSSSDTCWTGEAYFFTSISSITSESGLFHS